MDDDDSDFQFIDNNFPPNPFPIEQVNGKTTCDLTGYEAPPQFPSNITSHHKLQVLKVFIDNLECIPKDIGNLQKLEHLVLCRCESDITHETRITKIPSSLKNLTNLTVLDLRNNVLKTFPIHLTDLTCLEELHVSSCQLSTLPDELARLKELRTLDISNNPLKFLPLCVTKLYKLQKLYLSDGCIEKLCEEIKNLINLERLQLTNNSLSLLPEGLFELVHLKKLHINANNLTMLPDQVGNLVNLEYLVLNQNKLTKIPDTIGNLKELHYLNLHENMLFSLPESIIKLEQIETLLIDNNPLQVPPVHVCNQGVQSIRNYFHARENTRNIHSKRLKVVVVGESMAGKTSLVGALMKGESTQIEEKNRTFGVKFYHWKPQADVDDLELMVVDCAGQRKYQMTHQLFLSEGALFILAVDLNQYQFENPDSYQEHIGQWIALVAARIPRARILVVPTHIDECKNDELIDLKCRNIVFNIKEQIREMAHAIEKKSKFVRKTEGPHIPTDELEKILEQHNEQRNNLPVISLRYKEINDNSKNCDDLVMNVIPVSNITLKGMPVLREELVRIARNKSLSPNIDINLPESWVNIEQQIKNQRNAPGIPCLSITELRDILNEQGIIVNESELHSCVSYLVAIGELHYFKEIHGLTKNVVIDPYWLSSVFKQIFRHDLDEVLKYNTNVRMKFDVVPFRFELDKNELLRNGVMTQVLLKCLWSDYLDESDTIFPQLLSMLEHFGLACEMPAVANDLDSPDGAPPAVCYLMPWFFRSARPSDVENNWPSPADPRKIEVTTGFALLQYLPFGVFERFSVLCHRHEPVDYEHWRNGFFMQFDDDVLIQSTILRTKKCDMLRVAARARKNQLDKLWRVLLKVLEEVEKLLKEWPGMSFVPFTVCPECIKTGADQPHLFTCNWFRIHQNKRRKAVCKNKVNGTTHEVQLDHLFPSEDVLNGYQNPVTDEIPDCVLREDLLDGIARQLGTRWPRLARKLKLGGGEVDSIRNDYSRRTHEQAVEMLTDWIRKHGSGAKIKIVVVALRELEFNHVADYILSQSRAVENATDH